MKEKKKLSRKEMERLQQRHYILTCAMELFSEKGYHNVTMQEISEKSEFATGTLYKFFKNKEDMYRALMLEPCFNFINAFTEAISSKGNAIERLYHYSKVKALMFKENACYIRLFLVESRSPNFSITPDIHIEVKGYHNDFLKKLSQVFKDGIEDGLFKDSLEPFYMAVGFDAFLDSYLRLWIEQPEVYPFPDNFDAVLDIFFTGLKTN